MDLYRWTTQKRVTIKKKTEEKSESWNGHSWLKVELFSHALTTVQCLSLLYCHLSPKNEFKKKNLTPSKLSHCLCREISMVFKVHLQSVVLSVLLVASQWCLSFTVQNDYTVEFDTGSYFHIHMMKRENFSVLTSNLSLTHVLWPKPHLTEVWCANMCTCSTLRLGGGRTEWSRVDWFTVPC